MFLSDIFKNCHTVQNDQLYFEFIRPFDCSQTKNVGVDMEVDISDTSNINNSFTNDWVYITSVQNENT